MPTPRKKKPSKAVSQAAAMIGRKGAAVTNGALSADERKASARHAAKARWAKHKAAKAGGK